MTQKTGDLRVRKAGTVYGPMNRGDFDRLVAAGKFSLGDQVSVRGGAWMELGIYLYVASSEPASPAPDVASPSGSTAVSGAPEDNEAVLRLLFNKRIVAALSRSQVDQLCRSGRIADDDLICALNGPWMRVGDFLAPPAASMPVASHEAGKEPAGFGGDPAATAVSAGTRISSNPVIADVTVPTNPPPIAPVVIPGPAAVTSPSPVPAAELTGKRLTDEWFVRVRGIHSAPLASRHVKALLDAREITRDNATRHITWPENAWLRICEIPQLTDAIK